MLNPKHIKSRALKAFFVKGDASKINAQWLGRIRQILALLHQANEPQEVDFPGFNLHELKGDRAGTYSVNVTRNWRVTFQWDQAEGPVSVDLEDYHG